MDFLKKHQCYFLKYFKDKKPHVKRKSKNIRPRMKQFFFQLKVFKSNADRLKF